VDRLWDTRIHIQTFSISDINRRCGTSKTNTYKSKTVVSMFEVGHWAEGWFKLGLGLNGFAPLSLSRRMIRTVSFVCSQKWEELHALS
jgi:hypothetical protein